MNAKSFRTLAALGLATCFALAGPAAAQGNAASSPKAGMPCTNATASAPCMGTGKGMGMGKGSGGMAGANYTHGWSMMTPQERSEHQARMQGMSSAADCRAYRDEHHKQMSALCRAYRDEHHKQMSERAQAQGGQPLSKPRHDACAGMKP